MSQLQLLSQKKFLPLFVTQFLGAFNDNFLKNALVILVTFRAASVWGLPPSEIVALAGGIFILPFFLFSALAGQLADKYEKGTIIRWVKAIEIGIMVLATVGFISEHYSFLLIVLFMMGLHSTFFGPIKYSILPQHLKPLEIVGGNALVEAGTFVAILLGTIAGGVLIAWPNGPTIVSVALLVVAALGYLTSLFIPVAAPVAPRLKISFNLIAPTREIFGFASKVPIVFCSIIGISWFWFLGAVLLSLFPPLCKDILNGDEFLVTSFLAMFSVGIAAGSLLAGRLCRRGLQLGLIPLGAIGMTAMLIWFSWLCVYNQNHSIILLDLFLFSVCGGLFIVPLYTLMQERSDPGQRSRVIAANNILNALFMVVASLFLIGLFRLKVSIPQMILIHSGLNLGVIIFLCKKHPEFLVKIKI